MIGSEFELNFSALDHEGSNTHLKWFNSSNIKFVSYGRTALKAILISQDIKKILIPSYLCSSILQPLKELNIHYSFYKQDINLSTDINYLEYLLYKENFDAFLCLNYFGLNTSNKKILKKLVKNMDLLFIEDITHSFLNEEYDDDTDFYFASLRKWVPIPDGAFITGLNKDINFDSTVYDSIWSNKLSSMLAKNDYLKNNLGDKLLILNNFNTAEELLDKDIKISEMSSISKYILSKQNWENISKTRIDNYNFLLTNLPKNNIIRPFISTKPIVNVPLGFIITCEYRDKLKQHLINNKIYPPIHWILPDEIIQENDLFKESIDLSKSILTIPCDQRYDINDMKRIIYVLNNFINEYDI